MCLDHNFTSFTRNYLFLRNSRPPFEMGVVFKKPMNLYATLTFQMYFLVLTVQNKIFTFLQQKHVQTLLTVAIQELVPLH